MRRIRLTQGLTQGGDDLFMVLRFDIPTWGHSVWPERIYGQTLSSDDHNGNIRIEPGRDVAFIQSNGRVIRVDELHIDEALGFYGRRRAR